jgi:acetyltransferase-like isoleucine patch superfamily enzyme
MSLASKLFSLVRSIPFRLDPALRFCTSISVIEAVRCSIGTNTRLRGSIACDRASMMVGSNVIVARGSEINAYQGGSISIGNGVCIGKNSALSVAGEGMMLAIGDRTTFFSTVYLSGMISIGIDCLFGPNVTILSGEHVIEDRRPIRIQDAEYLALHGHPPHKPVSIGDDCWIGVNSVILPGVTLGKGCVVAAGAVVASSFSEYSIVGGVPARLLKYR